MLTLSSLALIFAAYTAALAQSETCSLDPNHYTLGQKQLDDGEYEGARRSFACAIQADPLNLDAYRGQIEADLLMGAYGSAMRGYTDLGIALNETIPDAVEQIIAGYEARLEAAPNAIDALTGYSFALWWLSDYQAALLQLDRLLALQPDNLYGVVFRGSTLMFLGETRLGEDSFARALAAGDTADIQFMIADAYMYGAGEVELAYDAAKIADSLGMNTSRLTAILGAGALLVDGDETAAAGYFARHIEVVTTEWVDIDELVRDSVTEVTFVPGVSFRVPLNVNAGERLSIIIGNGSSGVDTLLALVAPDGSFVTGSDDYIDLNAGFERIMDEGGTYTLWLTSFEGAGSGEVTISRE
jgi:tetratricopeptide (TPR) repeat protein